MSTLNPKMELVFEQISTHLLTQNARAIIPFDDGDEEDGNATCVYRSPDGLKCAVGCIITDENYSPFMEETSVSDESVFLGVERSIGFKLTEVDLELLTRLQNIHDMNEVKDWPVRLGALRQEYFG